RRRGRRFEEACGCISCFGLLARDPTSSPTHSLFLPNAKHPFSARERGVNVVYIYPLKSLPGGRSTAPRLRKQYRPIATAVLFACAPDDDCERTRSPRIMASG